MKKFRGLISKGKEIEKSRLIGIGLVFFGVVLLISIYLPIGISYIEYYIRGENDMLEEDVEEVIDNQDMIVVDESEDAIASVSEIFPDTDFGIAIPKIDTKAKVIADVDPFDEAVYTEALKEGIAHAQGTTKPGEVGNSFMFAHSAMGFYDLVSQNVNFYLLTKLEKGDSIYTVYDGYVYDYEVDTVELVDPTDVEYLTKSIDEDTLTLMTCWPAGTDYKRVVVVASKVE